MGMFNWWGEPLSMRGGSKCASTTAGGQCVITEASVVCKQLGYTITGCELCTIVVLSASGHMVGYRITKLLYIALA